MIVPKIAAAALFLVVLAAPGALASPAASHYVPKVGDSFDYYETIVLDDGIGNYSGYTEHQWINGTERITATAANGTDAAYYNYTGLWVNNQGGREPFGAPEDGAYDISARTYRYVHYVNGTDGQIGYSDPFLWYYMNNSLAVGDAFYLLNSEFHVESRNASFPLASSPTGYVATIDTYGTGSYARDDAYGKFTATYTWSSYFDPSTGYIVGYQYSEVDRNAAGDGFTWVDDLSVTHTSYALTDASAPAAAASGSSGDLLLFVAIVAIVIVVVVVAVALLARARRGPALPRHSPTGQVRYAPAPVGPPPPPIGLTPSGQPAVQQIVMRETVKVNCRYCGTLIDSTATVCPNCGAPRV